MNTTTEAQELSMKAIAIRIGNGKAIHAGVTMTNANGDVSILSRCGAEGRRYVASRAVQVDAEVTCANCGGAGIGSTTPKAPAQTDDQRTAAIQGNIARLEESLANYRGWLAAHPGDAGLIASIERAEASIARYQAM